MIPVCVPLLAGNEKKYVMDALDTNWISSAGKYISAFEEAFARYCNVKHGICTTNGTSALHLALTALGIGKGDEVIIPDFTMIASAFAVCYTGAMPVFVDVKKDTWTINPENIEEKITERTKAIMVVHVYGHPCDMDRIRDIAGRRGLKIIEDAAEVHGAEYNGKKCGSLGDIACFSFFANKIVTTGEGGMVVTDDEELARKCRYYKNLCFSLGGTRNYVHEDIGFNYRMSNLHAAIGLAQTEDIEQYVAMRRRNHALYVRELEGVKGISFQPEKEGSKNVYWMNGIVLDASLFGMSRDELSKKLNEAGIGNRLFFKGMHRQPALKKYGCDVSGDFPVSDWLADNGLYLPSGSGLTEKEIKNICSMVKGLA
jgi:perosamine synthetase